MKDFQITLLNLIKSALTGVKTEISENIEWEKVLLLAKTHKVIMLVYYGLYNSNITVPDHIFSDLSMHALKMAGADTKQEYEIQTLLNILDKSGIEYLPLKGMILKELYPKSEMRYMSDIDLLIKTEQYENLSKVMTDAGFDFVVESDHEYVWHKGVLHVEFHKHLIPSYNKDYFAYYNNGWKLAKKNSDNKYYLSDEDFFIYMFTHLAKHYRDSGIGIKHFVDIWVYLKEKKELDIKYIEKELNNLQLLDFYKNSLKMLDVWFSDGQKNDVTELMTEWIFSSGAFGTREKKDFSNALKKTKDINTADNIKKKLYTDTIFPSLSIMKRRYSILNKAPFLLPIFWVLRILNALFCKPQRIKQQKEKLNKLSKDNINEFETLLKTVGLEFNFKE